MILSKGIAIYILRKEHYYAYHFKNILTHFIANPEVEVENNP